MKKYLLTLIIAYFGTFSGLYSQTKFEIEGVTVPRKITFEENELMLNGFGVRSKMWLDVYVQALFLSNLSQDPKNIINGESLMAIRIQIISSLVSSKKLNKSLNKGLLKSVGELGMKKIEPQTKLLEKLLGSQPIKENDFFNLIYNPLDTSIWVYKNDKLEGKIQGEEFKKAFFGIWLSDNPVDEKLKNALLGIN
jgi:Chalcone isomerase-like